MIKTTSDMYILVREICVFIPATSLKRGEVLARIEQLRKRFLYCGKVFLVHCRGSLENLLYL
jgi:hypothetical protein